MLMDNSVSSINDFLIHIYKLFASMNWFNFFGLYLWQIINEFKVQTLLTFYSNIKSVAAFNKTYYTLINSVDNSRQLTTMVVKWFFHGGR